MELLSHKEFGSLRLAEFASDPSAIEELKDWEYEEYLWVGEAIGFTEWLRYADEPDVLGCLSLDLGNLPIDVGQKVFTRLHLPLYKGMNYENIVSVLGEPEQVQAFVAEQKSYEFEAGSESEYRIDCTIHSEHGLKYVVVMALGSSGSV